MQQSNTKPQDQLTTFLSGITRLCEEAELELESELKNCQEVKENAPKQI